MNAAATALQALERVNPREAGLVPQPQADNRSLVERAVDRGLPIEIIKEMMDLAERQRAIEARKAFDEAMARASAEMPTLLKTRDADRYKFEDLALVIEAVREPLSRYGLSFRWRTSQERGLIRVTCVVSHKDGHYEETSLEAAPERVLPSGNAVQNLGAAVSYLQRYTLKAALGVAATKDTDGVPPRRQERPEPPSVAHDEDGVIQDDQPRPAGTRDDPLLHAIESAKTLDALRALKGAIDKAGKPKDLVRAWNTRREQLTAPQELSDAPG
jgi:hypothetical protein